MQKDYSFLVHKSFKNQLSSVLAKHPSYRKKIQTQLEKSRVNPTGAGNWMSRLPDHLDGKIYKIWVGGKKGLRYIYYHDSSSRFVCPVFISNDIRPNFRYEDHPWVERAKEIHDALTDGSNKEFEIWDSIQP